MNDDKFTLQKAIPLLPIFDSAKAEEFYIDWLGFRSDWQHRFEDDLPIYWQVFNITCCCI